MALVVIVGAARSGKSAIANQMARRRQLEGCAVTCAVFGNPNGEDVEFAERIKNHRSSRPSEFKTLEAFGKADWLEGVPAEDLLIVDSLGTALSAIFASAEVGSLPSDSLGDGALSSPEANAFNKVVDDIISREGDTIVLCNDAGSGMVPQWESGRRFRDLNSYANRRCVAAADAAYLCVCGHLLDLKSLPVSANWPQD